MRRRKKRRNADHDEPPRRRRRWCVGDDDVGISISVRFFFLLSVKWSYFVKQTTFLTTQILVCVRNNEYITDKNCENNQHTIQKYIYRYWRANMLHSSDAHRKNAERQTTTNENINSTTRKAKSCTFCVLLIKYTHIHTKCEFQKRRE